MSSRFGPFGEFRDSSMDRLTIEHLTCQRDTAVEQLKVALDALAAQVEHNQELLKRLIDAAYQNTQADQENAELRKELDEATAALSELKEASSS